MIIYGAGLAGLLAAQMLRHYLPVLHESQLGLPNNHLALLRFRSDAASHATGIQFKKVVVHKAVKWEGRISCGVTSLQVANLYSLKVGGEVMSRSILSLDPVERYIAPDDFIYQMSKGLNIKYGSALVNKDQLVDHFNGHEVVVSTIPMPVLMELVDWPGRSDFFSYKGIWSVTAKIDEPIVRVYQTIYYPEDSYPYYRSSLVGSRLIVEYVREPPLDSTSDIEDVLRDFGIARSIRDIGVKVTDVKSNFQRYGKLLPVSDETVRRSFIFSMTEEYKLYSLGRFATWRQLLLDDVVKDVRVIESFMSSRDVYDRVLHKGGVS